MTTKKCNKCGIEKDINEFWKDKDSLDGCRKYCMSCEKEKRIKRIEEDYLKQIITVTLSRAKKDKLPYDSFQKLYDWLKPVFDEGKCEYCFKELDKSVDKGKCNIDSPSLDQIIPGEGYVIGNIILACFSCNRKKNNLRVDEMKNFINIIENKLNQNKFL